MLSPEMVKENLEVYKSTISGRTEDLSKRINNLSKNSLIRLVKVYSGIRFALDIIDPTRSVVLSKEEEEVLKKAMVLQDDCTGFTALNQELTKL